MTRPLQIEIGARFRLLVVLAEVPSSDGRRIRCRCNCGDEKIARPDELCSGRVMSCGCAKRQRAKLLNARYAHLGQAAQTKHGLATRKNPHPLFSTWTGMLQRCFYPKSEKYPDYGGRGITVCDRWRTDFAAFLSDMGEKPSPTHTLDRIDVNGNYEPGNCRWATPREQRLNQRPRLRHRDFMVQAVPC